MQYLVPSERIDVIYDNKVLGMKALQISERRRINYTTVINALNGYRENGRIFKLLPMHTKKFIMKQREQSKKSQKLYRLYRKNLEGTKTLQSMMKTGPQNDTNPKNKLRGK